MSKELERIFSGKATFSLRKVDYTTEKKKKEIDNLRKKQKEILRSGEVDIQSFNSFVIRGRH